MRATTSGLGTEGLIQDEELIEKKAEFFFAMFIKASRARKRKLHDVAFSPCEIYQASRTECVLLDWKLW